jgi:hypothetical protein
MSVSNTYRKQGLKPFPFKDAGIRGSTVSSRTFQIGPAFEIIDAKSVFSKIDQHFKLWNLKLPEKFKPKSRIKISRFKITKDFTVRSLLKSITEELGLRVFKMHELAPLIVELASALDVLPFDPITSYFPLKVVQAHGTEELFLVRLFKRQTSTLQKAVLEIYVYSPNENTIDDEWSSKLHPYLFLPH